MKLYDGSILIVLAVLAVLALGSVALTKVLKLEDDNIIENSIEDVIESTTGIEIDLSPDEETGGFIQGFDSEKFQQLVSD